MCIRDRCISGTARWRLNNLVVLPSVWSENVKLDCESDHEKRERVIEIFEPNRGYKGLVKKLNKERIIVNNRDLPCVINNDYIDDDNKHLPVVRVSVLA